MLPGARALEAALITGDEGGEVWRDRMDELWQIFRRAIARVSDDGKLAPRWAPEPATDWLWARVQPSTYAHLVDLRGWTPSDYTERTVRTLMDELVSSPHG